MYGGFSAILTLSLPKGGALPAAGWLGLATGFLTGEDRRKNQCRLIFILNVRAVAILCIYKKRYARDFRT
jgi:hypothetical protein